jgi:DNA polymerase elongation subunit (family B)
VAPNKNFDNQKDAKYSGAYVMDPKPGRYEWVYDLDLTSLYPSLIMSLNISPDTKISTIHDFDLQAFLKNEDRPWEGQVKNKYAKFKYTQWESTGHLRSWLEENKYSIAANGAIYNTRKKV